MCRHAQLIFKHFFVEVGSCCVAQAGLKLLISSSPPTLASQSAEITDVSHQAGHTRLNRLVSNKKLSHEMQSLTLSPRQECSSTTSTHCNSWVQVISPPEFRCEPPHPADFFVFLSQMEFHHVGQAGHELRTSNYLPALASQNAEITGGSPVPESFSNSGDSRMKLSILAVLMGP
ncbi:hypothetical protein AAY473_036228 [Plecturocebus cupreus]